MKKSYDVPHPHFTTRKLTVSPATSFSSAKLFADGVAQKKTKGEYHVRNDAGVESVIRLKSRFGDPIPVVWIDGARTDLEPPLTSLQYAFAMIPALMILGGGALGGLFGGIAVVYNIRTFRSDLLQPLKYISCILSLIGCFAIYLIVILQLMAAFPAIRPPAFTEALQKAIAPAPPATPQYYQPQYQR